MKKKDLKPGDILLYPPNEWIGKSIVAITKGKVSHAAIYYGDIKGATYIGHSHLRGAEFMLSDQFLQDAKSCLVRRYNGQSDLNPVLRTVDTYVQKHSFYPLPNMFLLGMLLISKRFSKNILHSKKFHNFLLYVTQKMILQLDPLYAAIKKGIRPMSCSQFVTQCFFDAGTKYHIKFKPIICEYDGKLPDKNSLLELIPSQDKNKSIQLEGSRSLLPERTILPEDEDQIVEDFINLLKNADKPSLIGGDAFVKSDEQELINTATRLFQYISVANPETINSSDIGIVGLTKPDPNANRIYMITPDDLLSNTKNLLKLGRINYRKP